MVSEDQKHSLRVAKVHYRKRRSRDVALKGNACLKRLRGEAGEKTDTILKEAFSTNIVQKKMMTAIYSLHKTNSEKEQKVMRMKMFWKNFKLCNPMIISLKRSVTILR